ncbi:hypothetical protein [Acetobacter syzygii]|uniref:Uncharacterized protein n=1 Tax=Acetobacter syzygii TaxID=146476 RepID=A0A270B7M3_9PROT|nr:hypothetical protein [Acetobacter syzygii]PAL21022.1 hypothetical protein B9K05_11725 [Acetobacter syzygii]PAL23353.1 hypothetical protein B9K04_11690 [Acetobacter syzygii]
MGETQFTPGPWRVRFGNIGHVTAENGALVAKCQRLTSLCNLQANARLIAAAPDLYEALERVIKIIDDSSWCLKLTEERAALAKARGETP